MTQVLVRGEAKTVEVTAVLLVAPTGRQFFVRVGRRGQVARVEAALTAGTSETLTDGKFRVTLTGTLVATDTAGLVKGIADVSVRATNPAVRLSSSKVTVEDDMGVGGAL